MFREKYLIFRDLKKLVNPFSTSQERAEGALNANEESTSFNAKRIELTSQELHHPIVDTVKSVREALKSAFIDLPKAAARKVAGVATDVTTSAIAIPANIGRFAMDLLRLPPRILLIASDTLAEQTFGRISRIAKSIRERVHGIINGTGGAPALAADTGGGNF